MTQTTAGLPPVVEEQEWGARLAELRVKEKALTRARDALAAERRRLPMVEFPAAATYRFTSDGPDANLVGLFAGRRQLIVYHFMHTPDDWCVGCHSFVDSLGALEPLNARDTTLAIVSETPWERLGPRRTEMGWTVPFYSCAGTTFAADTGTTIAQGFGLSVFLRATDDEGSDSVHRTYFTAGRSTDAFGNFWQFLDLTPFGRQETWEDTPAGRPQTPPYQWWRFRQDY